MLGIAGTVLPLVWGMSVGGFPGVAPVHAEFGLVPCSSACAAALTGLKASTKKKVFTDGGFVNGVGAVAAVFHLVYRSGDGFESSLQGVLGKYMSSPQSAFHAEAAALDLALEVVCAL